MSPTDLAPDNTARPLDSGGAVIDVVHPLLVVEYDPESGALAVSLARDWSAARARHEAALEDQRAEHRQRDLERMNAEAEAASHDEDTSELAARHEKERAADRAAEERVEAEENRASEHDVREAWKASPEIAADDADGPAMEARVNAFFDDVQRRDIARWTQHPEPEPPEFDEAETELEPARYDDAEAEL